MVKVKEVAKTKVSDNGKIKNESVDNVASINKRIESLTAQYNDSIKRSQEHKQKFELETDLQKRCLGGLETLQGLKKHLDPDTDGSN